MSSSKRAPSQATTIDLLPAEELLRDLLLECRQQLATPELEVWITGGWVRDRLMGIHCSDLDIALSTMSGVQFGNLLTEFLEQNEASYQQRALDLGIEFKKFNGFHSTKKNLDKSKKLETAVGRIFGLDLDLVNLRKEVYDDDCRTPEMEFNTAEEDAFRRDATANALFFDLQNRKVADFTRRGLDDLYAGIMRTPLEPRQTFLDDPLRVLRLIRIGSKLGFTLDPEALSCIKEHEIHVALDEKVSRERVGIEVFKMMKNWNPELSFSLIHEANLYRTVFLSLRSPLHEPLRHLAQDPARDFWALMESEKQKDMLWAMVAYAPLAELDTKDHKLAVDEAINALKGTRQLYKLIESSLGNLESIRSTMELVIGSTPSRGMIGMMIRKWGVFWGLQVLFSALGETVYLKPQPESPDPNQEEIDKVLRRHEALLSFAQKQRLNSVSSIRPILDGNAIKKALGDTNALRS
ncbi:CCA tRNA nucleotidyltransferase, mitochondrial [Fusarium odoratissimum]|uniref:CCA tRNA nucleotidyltransferase, mitochondrial n=1 Tax=Fusarium oxysporum f. sp. cubense (strain race 4) TaxID=2502994 RepID=N1RYP8_FUSC4|nr:CCA tRNA nucleotidyltransferase, mitochondrial [Fusarium odoratissimum]